MRFLSGVLLVIGAGCEVFAYWGVYTTSGRRTFDEMAGIIPMAFAPIGVLFIVGGVVVWWLGSRRRGTPN